MAADPAPGRTPFRAAVEAVQAAAHRHPDLSPAYFAELERGFRRVQAEFPSESEVYAELLFIADHTSGEPSVRLLEEILAWPASTEVKQKAEGVQRKKAALGRPYDFKVTTTGGRAFRLSDWRGRVVLVDFWATWCTPCREKLPEIQKLYDQAHARGLEIVGVSFDDDLRGLAAFVKKHRMPWLQVADGRGWEGSPQARQFGITSLPSMWLVDRQGVLRDLDAREDLARKVERLLAEKP